MLRSPLLPPAGGALLLLVLAVPTLAETPSLRPLRAERAPIVDGHLDDPVWERAALATDFVQQRPEAGAPASAETIVRVVYTSEALYVGFRCEEPLEVFHKALGRDVPLSDDDYFAVVLDPYLDRQNGVFFQVNPNGSRMDEDFRAEGELRNPDWDGVWRASTRVDAAGWQGEIEIPWRTLRFPGDETVSMGINFERQRRVVNEQSHWSAVERQYSIFRVSSAGTVTGLREIRPGRNVTLRPYLLSRSARGEFGESGSFDRDDWDTTVEIGGDVKVGITSNFTLDLTVNTDFAEVEVDDEIVNLTRFPILYPEKREFFLEKANLFDFGSPANRLFYSRRIGLGPDNRAIDIHYGSRLTGKVGGTEIGALDIQQGGDQSHRFDVLRVKQDVGMRSNLGVLAVMRNSDRAPTHRAIGLDADLNPTDSTLLSVYGAVTDDDGPSEDPATWGGRARWSHPLTVLTFLHESLGSDYRPVMGFAPRTAVDQTAVGWEFTPEPNWPWIRRFENQGFFYWFRRRHVALESRYVHVNPVLVGPSEERLSFWWERDFERLFEPFTPGGDVELPTGDYEFDFFGASLSSDPSRSLRGAVETEWGEFYDGDKVTGRATATLRAAPHWTVDFSYEINHIERTTADRVRQEFDSNLLRLRVGWDLDNAFGVRLFTQWNDADSVVFTQMRAHWIFGDESDLYFVITDEREDDRRDFAPRRGEYVLKLGYSRAL